MPFVKPRSQKCRIHQLVAEEDELAFRCLDDAVVDVERRLVRSMVGKGTKILNINGLHPKGQRLVVGENTTEYL